MDLVGFVGIADLYADIANDIRACGIIAEYRQQQGTVGACRYEGADVMHYPHVAFDDVLGMGCTRYADHIGTEASSFRFVECFGTLAVAPIMLLLRDRYFPRLWSELVRNSS